MDTDLKWVVVHIDGKTASISTDYKHFAKIAAELSKAKKPVYRNITCTLVSFNDIWQMRHTLKWEDFHLFGTPFQKKVWQRLYDLTHKPDASAGSGPDLISYTDFADLCGNKAGVRAVAHAISLNPLPVVIPCHLVIPKESIDKINEIRRKADLTLFKTDGLVPYRGVDFGEYTFGRTLKRQLVHMELESTLQTPAH